MLFTTDQLDQLERNAAPMLRGGNHIPVAKLILPGTGCAWLLTELHDTGQYQRAYGLADHGMGGIRIGTVSLQRLAGLTDPFKRHHVQRDQAFVARYPLSVYAYAAHLAGRITDDEHHLAEAAQYCAAFERQRAVHDEPLPQEHSNAFSPQAQAFLHPSPI